MSEGTVCKLPKPKLRGLLHARIKKTLIIAGIAVAAEIFYMKFIFGNERKQKYAAFYKNYDIEKEFDLMRNKGLFQSAPPDEEK